MTIAREQASGMEVLVTLADEGSFSRAAKRLGLTPSAVSKVLTRIEGRLGAQLVQRTTRSMHLTEAGRLYTARARAVLEAIADADREIEGLREAPRGVLRISAPLVLGLGRVLPLVATFQRRHAEVKIDLELSDRVVDLVAEGFDVAIRVVSRPPEGVVARKLWEIPRVLVASRAYVERRGKPRAPLDLAKHDCVRTSGGGAMEAWRLRRSGTSRGALVRVGGRVNVTSVLGACEACRLGLGIAELPRYLVEDDLARGTLVEVLAGHAPEPRTAFALFGPSPVVSSKVRAFVDHLVSSTRK